MTVLPICTLPWKGTTTICTGIYAGISNADYHAESSGLGHTIADAIAFESPAHAREKLDHPKEPTEFMEFGTLVHCGTLEPERLSEAYYVEPETYPGKNRKKQIVQKKWRYGSDYCDRWAESHADRPIISAKDEAMLHGCVKALKQLPDVSGMLSVGHAELSCFAQIDGLLVKCRPDLMAYDQHDRLWVLDIKKCQDASLDGFRKHARQRRLDFQEAWYRRVLAALGLEPHKFLFVGVEQDPPHGARAYELERVNVEANAEWVEYVMQSYRQCVESCSWPGYERTIGKIGWPVRKEYNGNI